MHGTQIAEQRDSLGRIFDQRTRSFQLLHRLGQFALLTQHRAESPKRAVVLWIQKPGLIEAAHGDIVVLRPHRGPTLRGYRVAASLPAAVAQRLVADKCLISLFEMI